MKKIVQTALILTLASVAIIGCKKKEDPAPNNNNNNNSSIQGTWNMDSIIYANFFNDSTTYSNTVHFASGNREILINGSQYIMKATDSTGAYYDTASYYITDPNIINIVSEYDSAMYDTSQYTFSITNSNQLSLYYEVTYTYMGDTVKYTSDQRATRK